MLTKNDAQVPVTVGMSAIGQFESNEVFQKHSTRHAQDSGFSGTQGRRKAWVQPKGDTRTNREVMNTLLASQGDDCNDCIEKLLAVEISYRDLASLTHKDLELMGFKQHRQREELLNLFVLLPNQDPTYDNICQLPEAQHYNSEICHNASQQMLNMRSAIVAANYKLQIMPPEDVIVGEKSFASRFVLEALSELRGLTDEISNELEQLEGLITGKPHAIKVKRKSPSSTHDRKWANWLLISSVATVALTALWYYKTQKLLQ